jgi:sulfur carrier protein ThiS adenylyltransferase
MLQLYDFDTVEPSNVTSQGYASAEVGMPKVLAMQQAVERIDPELVVTAVLDRWRPQHDVGDAIFCCVDSISARAAVWRGVGDQCRFWSDGRMLGESVRVLSASTEEERRHYAATLFPQSEAHAGRCTSRSTLYAAAICAGLMLHQFTRWLRGVPLDRDLSLGLLASDLVVG